MLGIGELWGQWETVSKKQLRKTPDVNLWLTHILPPSHSLSPLHTKYMYAQTDAHIHKNNKNTGCLNQVLHL